MTVTFLLSPNMGISLPVPYVLETFWGSNFILKRAINGEFNS